MLKKLTQKKLNKLLDDHELWVKSKSQKGNRLKLQNENLLNFDFSGRDLTGAIFVYLDMDLYNLCKTTFAAVEFTYSVLVFADFTEDDLIGAEYPKDKLSGIIITKNQSK